MWAKKTQKVRVCWASVNVLKIGPDWPVQPLTRHWSGLVQPLSRKGLQIGFELDKPSVEPSNRTNRPAFCEPVTLEGCPKYFWALSGPTIFPSPGSPLSRLHSLISCGLCGLFIELNQLIKFVSFRCGMWDLVLKKWRIINGSDALWGFEPLIQVLQKKQPTIRLHNSFGI